MTRVQEVGGREIRTKPRTGEYAINDTGAWHPAEVREHATALFDTVGTGIKIGARRKGVKSRAYGRRRSPLLECVRESPLWRAW
jgi:hypothetical protein